MSGRENVATPLTAVTVKVPPERLIVAVVTDRDAAVIGRVPTFPEPSSAETNRPKGTPAKIGLGGGVVTTNWVAVTAGAIAPAVLEDAAGCPATVAPALAPYAATAALTRGAGYTETEFSAGMLPRGMVFVYSLFRSVELSEIFSVTVPLAVIVPVTLPDERSIGPPLYAMCPSSGKEKE